MERVLVVDDAQDNITLLTFDLEDDGFEVLPALSGEECLLHAKADIKPDIILLDINMPNLSGIETLLRLKDDDCTADIPVIMVSATDRDEVIVEAIDHGAHDFVSKPIEYPVLAARMRSALRLSQALSELEKANNELNTLATTDSLTGTYNRRHFFSLSCIETAKMDRHNRPVSLMMLDIDHFKKVNDKHGHAAGDMALRSLTQCSRRLCRSYDIFGRIGGEEFAICSPYADLAGATVLAERLLKGCRDMELMFNHSNFSITISIGLTELRQNEKFDIALQRADALLYQAKKNGRNQIVANLDSPPPA